jgi:teichuronic acid biosynthesis glycosyltransferase TuaC
MKVLMACQNHPDPYNPYWGLFIERSISSIVEQGIDATAIIPRSYVIPIKCFPQYKFSKLPFRDNTGLYEKHYPRYFYFAPKKIFYGLSGDSYSHFITKYAKKNIDIPDIIHAHHVYMDGYGMAKLSKEWDVPLVMVEHGTVLKKILQWKNMRKKIIHTLNLADHIMCVSDDLLSIVMENGIDEDKLSLVPIGVDTDIFKKGDSTSIREQFGICSETKIVLYVGQLVQLKGLKYLMDSIPHILSKHHDVLFVLAGEGPLKKKISELIKQNGLDKNIILLGAINYKNLVQWYSISDIFVLPSLSEGRPSVIYEAMSCEVPIIATDVGGVSEQIKDGYNGFVIKPKDSRKLADKINYLLENDDLRNNMGKNGRKRIIEEGWTWKSHAKNAINVYKKLL